jgi:glycosyltransferase involved in cell wall biosynthesis
MRKIKVLHVIAGDRTGGAAKGALTLHMELIKAGVDSCVLMQVGEEDPVNQIYTLSATHIMKWKRFLLTFLDRLPLLFYKRRRQNVAFSFGCFGFDITKSKFYKQADLINLHWINQGTLSLRTIKKIDKPIVWTIRDMWLMTGGCHHSFDCNKYTKTCTKCPILGSSRDYDLSSFIQEYKRKILHSNIHYVAISNWLKLTALKSTLLKNEQIKVIHNGISLSEFRAIDKTKARTDLRLPLHRKILLLGASNLHDPYKGFSYFLECLPALLRDSELFFIFFGNFAINDYGRLLGDRFVSFGPVSDVALLNTIYSSADLFIAPSIAEAFGKTLVEAMLSGTPVVCFDSTGPSEIISHQITGYKALDKDASDLCSGIFWCIDSKSRLAELSSNARFDAVKRFGGGRIALQYKELYEEVVNGQAYHI